MPQLRDFFSRFRPAGAPGAAARAGVPADRLREREAEVGPVLALLDSTEAECERIVGQARRDAGVIMADARAALEKAKRAAPQDPYARRVAFVEIGFRYTELMMAAIHECVALEDMNLPLFYSAQLLAPRYPYDLSINPI